MDKDCTRHRSDGTPLLGANPQAKGPRWKTCASCRTRPAVGIATHGNGVTLFFIHLCDRCQPGEEGWTFEFYDGHTIDDEEMELDAEYLVARAEADDKAGERY